MTLGVPLISPVDVSKFRPDGRFGEIDQVTTGPPVDDGVTDVIAESLVSTNVLGLYEIEDGATSFTVITILVFAEPPELFA